ACRSRSETEAGELLVDRLGRQLAEERLWLLQRLTGGELARRPRSHPARVVAGEHVVRRAVVLGLGADLERAGEIAVVAEQLVHDLRRERQERREQRLQ